MNPNKKVIIALVVVSLFYIVVVSLLESSFSWLAVIFTVMFSLLVYLGFTLLLKFINRRK